MKHKTVTKITSLVMALLIAVSMIPQLAFATDDVDGEVDYVNAVTANVEPRPQGASRAMPAVGETRTVSWAGENGCRYDFKGYSEINKLTESSGNGWSFVDSAGDTVFCVDPFILQTNGASYTTRNMLGYYSITQSNIDYLACGVDYILNKWSGSTRQREAAAQGLIWKYLSGKASYRADSMILGDSLATEGMKAGEAYADKNAKDAIGRGMIYTTSDSQPMVRLSVTYIPKGNATVRKSAANNKHLTELCPENYSLAGAIYGIYGDDKEVGRFNVKADGSSDIIELPVGDYTVKEIAAPKGYALDPKTYNIKVVEGKTAILNVKDEPIFDALSFKLQKMADEDADKNLSLEGAEYTIKYYKEKTNDTSKLTPFRTWIFATDKTGVFKLNEKWRIGGDELFEDEGGEAVGLHGTYTFEETKAPYGFAKTDGIISTQVIDSDEKGQQIGSLKDITDVEKAQTVSLKIYKVDEETGEPHPQGYGSFEGAEFEILFFDSMKAADVKVANVRTDASGIAEIKGLTPGKYTIKEVTGPAGYLVSEENIIILAGIKELNTANFEYTAEVKEKPITVEISKTGIASHGIPEMPSGAELQLIDSRGETVETWTTDGNPKVFKGLPAGRYTIKEVKVPDGYLEPIEDFVFEVKPVQGTQQVDVFNEPEPLIKTEAFFDGGTKNSLPKKEVHLIDGVSYDRLIPGAAYTIKGKLVDADDPEHVVALGETTFDAEKSEGRVNVKFDFDASELQGKKLVVFEEIYKDGRLLASHSEISDKDQTVTIPEIGTTASDKSDGDKYVTSDKNRTVTDIVRYSMLTPGKEYLLKGRLIDKNTGEAIAIDGKEITAEKRFTPEAESGEVILDFTFDASLLAGKTVVAFESVMSEGIEIAVHADIEDEAQTVYIPAIRTKASSKAGGKIVLPLKEVTVTDTIYFRNFETGKAYFVEGFLIDKKTKAVLSSASLIFEAKAPEGEAALDFLFDASRLAGQDTVIFERIFEYDKETGKKGKLFAMHEDFDDAGQMITVSNPAIKTLASVNGSKRAEAAKRMELKDKVMFSGLVPGLDYTAELVWMDKTTGKPLELNGEKITAKKMFKPSEASGEIEIRTSIDGTIAKNAVLVAFEKISYNGEQIAAHEDIKSAEQAVSIFIKEPIVKTGDRGGLLYALIFAGTGLFAMSLMLIVKNRRRKSNG